MGDELKRLVRDKINTLQAEIEGLDEYDEGAIFVEGIINGLEKTLVMIGKLEHTKTEGELNV